MKAALPLVNRYVNWIKNLVLPVSLLGSTERLAKTKSEGLLQLYESQHRVILGIFRIGIAGFCAFFVISVSFTLFTFFDPYAPIWVAYMMIIVGALLLFGLYRTLQEFKTYLYNYANISERLRDTQRVQSGGAHTRRPESRVLSVLKPKEHKGWDAKTCENCNKSIELLANVCQHCGHEQETLLVN